ncbi:hypothetical protein FACS1894180_4310 [Bacteroidia bacterium]|nr:hypothetical protein FACS1894180_4310 [Bacteroidia bacterium]
MKKEIAKVLKQLIGYKLTRSTRMGATECLKFGILYSIDHKGIEWQIGEFAIHLQCPWRITKNDTLIVGSDDVSEQPDENAEYDENFNWDIQGGNLRDVKLQSFIKLGKCMVQSITTDDFGGFELTFIDNIKLTVFPALSSKNFGEHWRLLDNRNGTKCHYVIDTCGVTQV